HRAQRELEAEFAARDRSFIFNAWFESVKAVTFPSAAVPLTKEDIEALARAADDALALIPSTKTRACDSACLEALASKLDAAVATVAGSGAFVRLNYLSPKDAVMDNLEQLGAAAKWPAIQVRESQLTI
ncbi:Ide, partial [Symbiodinium pilosum]